VPSLFPNHITLPNHITSPDHITLHGTETAAFHQPGSSIHHSYLVSPDNPVEKDASQPQSKKLKQSEKIKQSKLNQPSTISSDTCSRKIKASPLLSTT
jgi:hypothetical protein